MSTVAAPAAPSSKGLHAALWGVQVLLGLAFLGAGVMKATTPIADLATKMSWVPMMGEAMTRFIGISELLGGLGLILPAATRIQPKLTGIAGAALAFVMVLAAGTHAYLGEFGAIGVNVVLGGLAGFVAWGRLVKAPIQPR
jgi:hypothetical protein